MDHAGGSMEVRAVPAPGTRRATVVGLLKEAATTTTILSVALGRQADVGRGLGRVGACATCVRLLRRVVRVMRIRVVLLRAIVLAVARTLNIV